jgi:hypothetical protein
MERWNFYAYDLESCGGQSYGGTLVQKVPITAGDNFSFWRYLKCALALLSGSPTAKVAKLPRAGRQQAQAATAAMYLIVLAVFPPAVAVRNLILLNLRLGETAVQLSCDHRFVFPCMIQLREMHGAIRARTKTFFSSPTSIFVATTPISTSS